MVFRVSAFFCFWLILFVGRSFSAPEFFPLDEIRPGMKGIVYTVMQGSEVVPLEAEILGILKGGLGPGRHMIIGKLVDEKTKLTGAVHGMSGSPLMIDGKLVGALSRRLGTFEKDGHCGFTPAEDMQDVARRGYLKPPSAALLSEKVSATLSESEVSTFSVPLAVSGGADHWSLLSEELKSWFPGTLPIAGGITGKGAKSLPPIKAGSPLAVVMMDGDITISGTGTTTWVDDDQVIGFGHPMFGLGPAELPIAPAEIVSVLPSYLRPYKIANVGKISGTLDQDRLSAISGRIGPIPSMAEYRVTRIHNNEARPEWRGRFVKHHILAPQMISIIASNAMMDAQDFSGDFTMRAKATVQFKGLDTYEFDGFYSGGQRERITGFLNQLIPLLRVMNEYEQQLEVQSVRFDVESVEERNQWNIISFDCEKQKVKVGESLKILVQLKNVLGETRNIRLNWSPPEELRGKLIRLECASGLNLNLIRRNSRNLTSGGKPEDAIEYLKPQYYNDQLYVRGVIQAAGFLKSGNLQVGLPQTIARVSAENPAPTTKLISEGIIYNQKAVPVDGMISGTKSKLIQVN